MNAPSRSSSTTRGKQSVPAPPFRWSTRVVLPIGILLAFAWLFAGSIIGSLTSAVEVEAIPVIERPAIKGTASNQAGEQGSVLVQAAGWIEPAPFPVFATALTGGVVEEVAFLEGDEVAKGDVLVRLVDDDARLALQRAEAEDLAAKEVWEANIEARREASVASAAVREASASLELARAELEVEQALLREAERIHSRRKRLVANESVSQEEHDTSEATEQAQAARVRVVERRIEQRGAQLEGVRAEQTAAQRRLEFRTEERLQLDLTSVALKEAQLRLERTVIHSPIDGVVMQRLVEPGSMLTAFSDDPQMARVASLYNPRRMQVRVDVPLADVAKIGVGQPAQIVVEVLPERIFSGKATRITNYADIQKNTLEVKVALEDPAPELKPDMLARVSFLAAKKASDEQIPAGTRSVFALASAIEGDVAWVVSQYDGTEGVAIRRTVSTTGAEDDGWLEIASGLQPGDLLVVSSSANLQPNQRVRVRQERVE